MKMPNLSSWEVTFTRGFLGWRWRAEHADGTALVNPLGMWSITKESAEQDALRYMVRHEQREEISGFELQERLGYPPMSDLTAESFKT